MTRVKLRSQDGSALVTALMVMLVMLPLGLALLAIVDTQARDSGSERTRDRAFNLADSALSSAAFSLSRYSWPVSAAAAPNHSGTPAAAQCGLTSIGAPLGDPTNAGSTTARLQPNLNASYDDDAYAGATWQINICDDDPAVAGAVTPVMPVWDNDTELLRNANYDANHNGYMWIRSTALVGDHRRTIAALVKVGETPAFSSKYGLMTGRMNAEVRNTADTLLTGPLLDGATSALLGTDPLVAADPSLPATSPASTGVIGVRCGALDGCLTGTLGGLGALPLFNTLVTGGRIVQATSPSATSAASIAQLRQQAVTSLTHVPVNAGSVSSTSPPACTIPAGANASTVVFIDQVGTTGTADTVGGPGDQYCLLDVSTSKAFKALVIGRGRVVVRGNNSTTAIGAASNTFSGLLYATNEQRDKLGDAATPAREVIRIDRGAHVKGGVAADGKSAQVGVYPPQTPVCSLLDAGCLLDLLTDTLGVLTGYNPAIQSSVALMDAVKVYSTAAVVRGTYRDVAGEMKG